MKFLFEHIRRLLPDLSSRSKRVGFAFIVLVLGAGAFGFTVSSAVYVSTFAAGLFKAAICVALFVAFDEVFLDAFDTSQQLKDNPIAIAIALLALALLLAPAVATAQMCPAITEDPEPELYEVAEEHIGVTETPTGSNEGEKVEEYLDSVGLSGGYAWCAAFAHYVMLDANVEPPVRSAGATDYITDESISTKEVIRGTAQVPANALSIHRRGNTWRGHIGIVRTWDSRCGRTIEGNTSSGKQGSQYDGDGVWARERCLNPGNYFRIVAFTPTG